MTQHYPKPQACCWPGRPGRECLGSFSQPLWELFGAGLPTVAAFSSLPCSVLPWGMSPGAGSPALCRGVPTVLAGVGSGDTLHSNQLGQGSSPDPWVAPGSDAGSVIVLGLGDGRGSALVVGALLWAQGNTRGTRWLHPGLGSAPPPLCVGALPARAGAAGSRGAWGGLGEGAGVGLGVLQAGPRSAWHPRGGTALTRSLPTGC